MPLSTHRTVARPERPVPGLYILAGAVVLVTRYHGPPGMPTTSVEAVELQAVRIEHEGDDTGKLTYLTRSYFEKLEPFVGSVTLENMS